MQEIQSRKMHFLMKSARYTCGTTKKCKFSDFSANFSRFDPLKIRRAADFEGVRGGPYAQVLGNLSLPKMVNSQIYRMICIR